MFKDNIEVQMKSINKYLHSSFLPRCMNCGNEICNKGPVCADCLNIKRERKIIQELAEKENHINEYDIDDLIHNEQI